MAHENKSGFTSAKLPTSDPPPYTEVISASQSEHDTKILHSDIQQPLQVEGYSYGSGYQPVPGTSGNPSNGAFQHTPRVEYNTKSNSESHAEVVVSPLGQAPLLVTQQRPPDYLWQSILACLCCCFPIGLVAIYFACQANTLVSELKMEEAWAMSARSRNTAIISAVVGIMFYFLSVLYERGMLSGYRY